MRTPAKNDPGCDHMTEMIDFRKRMGGGGNPHQYIFKTLQL